MPLELFVQRTPVKFAFGVMGPKLAAFDAVLGLVGSHAVYIQLATSNVSELHEV